MKVQNDKKFIPVMLMPFQEDEKIDYSALGELVEYYLDAGAGGLFANCLSSEMFNLSKEEMLTSVSFIVEKVRGRVPIVATGTFEDTIENQAKFVKEIYATGVDAVIVITGLLAKEHDREDTFRMNVEKLLEWTADVPLGFYECPVPYKRIMQPDFLGQLAKTGRVKYHKDTSLDMTNVEAKIRETADCADFGVYDAYMGHAVDTLKAGSAGLSCIQGNYFPEMIVWLCNNYDQAHSQDKVAQVQQFLIDHMKVMHYAYPTSAKYVLHKLGYAIQVKSRRRDIEELDNQTQRNLDSLMQKYSLLKAQLGGFVNV